MGALVVAVASAIAAWIHFGSARNAANGYDLQVRLPKADGLSTGSDVRISGIRIGSVTSLNLDPNSYLVTVHMNIRSDIQVPVDSIVEVASSALSSNFSVAIVPGASKALLAPGGMFERSCASEDVMAMVGRVGLSNGQGNCPKH